jgi:ParB family chromosome partitioning protein
MRSGAGPGGSSDDTSAHDIVVAQIVPSDRELRAVRRSVDELAASIQAYGLLQPLLVRPLETGYMLIAGHRRLAAIKLLGWESVRAIVRRESPSDAYLLSLVENLQRADLGPREEARALEALLRERAWSTRQVAAAIHRSASFVSRRLRVFDDPLLGAMVLSNRLAVSSAEELLTLPGPLKRALAERAVDEAWDHARIRNAVRLQRRATNDGTRGLSTDVRELRQRLRLLRADQLTPAQLRDLRLLFEDLAEIARAPTTPQTVVLPSVPVVSVL